MTGQTPAYTPYEYCDKHQFIFVFFLQFCFVFARSHGIGEKNWTRNKELNWSSLTDTNKERTVEFESAEEAQTASKKCGL